MDTLLFMDLELGKRPHQGLKDDTQEAARKAVLNNELVFVEKLLQTKISLMATRRHTFDPSGSSAAVYISHYYHRLSGVGSISII